MIATRKSVKDNKKGKTKKRIVGKERKGIGRRSKFLSARNRIREWFMGLHRGRIHGVQPVFFIFLRSFSRFLGLVLFVPPLPPHEPRHGGSPCARNLNPLVIKSGLYATSGTPCARAARAFTYEKVKCIQVGSVYMACVADQV